MGKRGNRPRLWGDFNNVNRSEGTGKGFDTELLNTITKNTSVPVIASGGFGDLKDVKAGFIESKADAIAVADAIHYNKISLRQIRKKGLDLGLNLRDFNQ